LSGLGGVRARSDAAGLDPIPLGGARTAGGRDGLGALGADRRRAADLAVRPQRAHEYHRRVREPVGVGLALGAARAIARDSSDRGTQGPMPQYAGPAMGRNAARSARLGADAHAR